MSEDPDALWRSARDEPSPFVRQRLFEQAAEVLITATGGELRQFCVRQLAGDEAGGDDVAQHAFLMLWKLMPRFAGRSTLKTFLFGIALNLCRRLRRDEGRAARLSLEHFDDIRDEVHPDDLVTLDAARERQDRIRELERCLAQMDQREAWMLRARLVDELGYAAMLVRYRTLFGHHITTKEGLRTAFFRARKHLEAMLGGRR